MRATGSSTGDLTEKIRARGLRVTRPRLAVYRFLQTKGGHRSVDEIVAGLELQGESLPRMSVYNVVTDLVGAGLVMLADAGPGRALYEAGARWHHHFVCRACGVVHDVPCAIGEKPCLQPSQTPGTVDEAQVIFRGICHDCENRDGRH